MKPIYRVSFFKRVADSTGHLFNPVQGAIEVHAENANRAVELARLEFAKQKQVGSSTLRADSEHAELLPGRKRAHLVTWYGPQIGMEKVVSFLLEDRRSTGTDGRRLDLPMSRTDMADYLGLTIETVGRTA